MSDFQLSKRFVVIGLLIIALLATCVGIGVGYYYQHQKTVREKLLISPPNSLNSGGTVVNLPTVPEVLSTLFGVKTHSNTVENATNQLSSLWFTQSFTHDKDTFQAFFVKTQEIDPDSKSAVNSHADAANISVVVYQLKNKQWQLFSKQINVGSFGNWGDVQVIEKADTLKLSANTITFLMDGSWSGQGYTEEGKGLFNFEIKNKMWQYLGFVQTGMDNAGVCDDSPQPKKDDLLSACWKFTGEIRVSKRSKNINYPDLIVNRKGTSSDDTNKIVPAKEGLYVFNGEQYSEKGVEAR